MKPSDKLLSKALHELADESPRGASPELSLEIKAAFARHHARRRRNRMAFAAVLATCLLFSLVWLHISRTSRPLTTAKNPAVTSHPAASSSTEAARRSGTATVTKAPNVQAISKAGSKARSKVPSNHVDPAPVATADFVALPTFDPSVPPGPSHMVRLELPGSALQLIGYPVDGDLLQRRVLTDVLVGQDGMPYAVRLVQTGTTY